MTEMFQNTLNIIPNGVLIIDIKEKLITFANKGMANIVSGPLGLEDKTHFSALRESIC